MRAVIAVADLVPLARGGTSDVFVARAGTDRVIVKVPHASALVAGEAAILADLDGSVAPRLLGLTQVTGSTALVLEHLALPTLGATRGQLVDLEARRRAAAAICDAVATLHARGIVHGDLAPDNILVSPEGMCAARLIDFGAAATIGAPLPPAATLAYAAPERSCLPCIAAEAIDVYALATLCFELLTTIHPFGAGTARRIGHAARRAPRLADRGIADAALDEVMARALAKDPSGRPPARALADALAAPLAVTPASPPTAVVPDHDITRTAMLVGCTWPAGTAQLAAAARETGGVVAHSAGRDHVIALWSSAAPERAHRLAAALERAGARDVRSVEAAIRIGAHGVPRGAAIIALARRRTGDVVTRAHEPALVGRGDVLATLEEAACEAHRGRPALVVIEGEPGLGKSRLATAIEAAPLGLEVLSRPVLAGAARERADALVGTTPRLIIVDDAHAADPVTLDAIELLARRERGAVAIVVLARPALLAGRPRFAACARWYRRLALAPFARDEGRALVRALLPTNAVVPVAAIDRLVARCGGVPLYIREVVAAILAAEQRRGATRGALPTDLVELIPEGAVLGWIVGDELARITPGARVAAAALALCGTELARADAVTALDAVALDLDPDVAIAELVAARVLVPTGAGWRFRHDLVRDAIERGLAGAERSAYHARLLPGARDAATRARHAEGCGERAVAVAAWTEVAASAAARHDLLGEELALDRALACAERADLALVRRRGAARASLGRHDAAASDFALAATLARAAGDRAALAEVLLDEAMALDWALHHAAAASRVHDAAALIGDADSAERRARLALALGRTAWRAGDRAAALAPLRRALALAEPLGDACYVTAIAARLMLGFLLATGGELAEADAVLAGALARATARGDLVHVAAARCNRYPLHAARGDLAAARTDLAAFAALGRELGNTVTAYRGELYLALLALWTGEDTTAHHHAIAAHRLEAADPELLARPRAALVLGELAARAGDRAATVRWCELASAHGLGDPSDAITLAALDAWTTGTLAPPAARALADRAVTAGEPEAAYQILELCARTAATPVDRRAARWAAQTLAPLLPRFITPEAA